MTAYMKRPQVLFSLYTLITCALLLASCGGSSVQGNNGDTSTPTFSNSFAWPPAVSHTVSANVGVIGSDYSEKNGLSYPFETQLRLVPQDIFGWSMYTFSDIPAQDGLGSVIVDAAVPSGESEQQVLFVGLSNYTRGAWEWFEAPNGDLTSVLENGIDYLSPTHQTSIIVAYCGLDVGEVNSINITTTNAGLEPPTNLSAVAGYEEVTLTWDAYEGAEGYFVERDEMKDFSSVQRLNTEPVTETQYLDDTVAKNKLYYYRVIAVKDAFESTPSSYVDVHTPQVDLAAPTNVRVQSAQTDSVTIAWDWDGSSPSSFIVFVASQPDVMGAPNKTVPGFMRNAVIDNLSNPSTIYVRILAISNSGYRGIASDDIAASTLVLWQWNNETNITAGEKPIAAVSNDNSITVAYNGTNGLAISQLSGSSWSSQQVSTVEITEYIDIAYSTGNQVGIVECRYSYTDLMGSIMTPSSTWVSEKIHGNGISGMGSDVSGWFCSVTGCSTEYATSHYDASGSMWRIHTSSASPSAPGSWSEILSIAGTQYCYANMAYDETGNLYCAYFDGSQLLLADRNSGWSFNPVFDASLDGLGYGTKLARHNSQWEAISMLGADHDYYYITGTTAPWSAEEVCSSDTYGTIYTPLSYVSGNPAFISYSSSGSSWYFHLRSGYWQSHPISNAQLANSNSAALGVLNGTVYVIFADASDGQIKYITGIPPA